MVGNRRRPARIVIKEADLPPLAQPGFIVPQGTEPEILRVTLEDLPAVGQQDLDLDADDALPIAISLSDLSDGVLAITLRDLATADQHVIHIARKDLPPIMKIRQADLPPDLNHMTTECYHGTSRGAAEQILRQGFRVGGGNALGSGIYFSIGGMTIARGYTKTAQPCIIRARVGWGKVAYLDDPKLPAGLRGSGDSVTERALRIGYHSFLTSGKFSQSAPAIGIVLGKQGSHITPPRIEVVELIDPHSSKS